jgi:DNA-binding NarL/FixJ family response regulator
MNGDAVTQEAVPAVRASVLVVDDHPIVREGLAELIDRQEDLSVFGQASSATEALGLLEAGQPDLAIVDIFLEGSNGLELTQSIKASYPAVKVLVVSMHEEERYALRALRAGASGYIMKQKASRQILDALRRVREGELYVSSAVKQKLDEMQVQDPSTLGTSPIDILSGRELEVFELLGRGATRRTIAEGMGISVKTVEAHRSHIREKLTIPDAKELERQATMWVEGRGAHG